MKNNEWEKHAYPKKDNVELTQLKFKEPQAIAPVTWEDKIDQTNDKAINK